MATGTAPTIWGRYGYPERSSKEIHLNLLLYVARALTVFVTYV